MTCEDPAVPIVIVSYRTPNDVNACLNSLGALDAVPSSEIYICENGGAGAWNELCKCLLAPGGTCVESGLPRPPTGNRLLGVACLKLRESGRLVFVGQATENLGYSGGINAWLESLAFGSTWEGCWILNPDAVAAPGSLSALVREARDQDFGMVGSRLLCKVATPGEGIVGLRWQRVLARTVSVVLRRNSAESRMGRQRMTAASGASVYVTRPCLEQIAPFDERYFLYFEDLDWGVTAQRAGYLVGFAHDSIVIHAGGGSTGARSVGYGGSRLAVYLQFRNRLLFVSSHYPRWVLWTALISWMHALRLVAHRAFLPAAEGILGGLRGESGRPDWLVDVHKVPKSTLSSRRERFKSMA
jgi:GT2 family glycosyltransferase